MGNETNWTLDLSKIIFVDAVPVYTRKGIELSHPSKDDPRKAKGLALVSHATFARDQVTIIDGDMEALEKGRKHVNETW